MSATAVRAMAAVDTDTDAEEDGVNPSTHFEWAGILYLRKLRMAGSAGKKAQKKYPHDGMGTFSFTI